jgi:uncharacterized repeat protein (TIGR04076 family)
MYTLEVQVKKILGECTANPPCEPGDVFYIRDGDIRIPEGNSICMWALQSMLPLITLKEREIAESKDDDWVWRVHHVQCPDPEGRVIYKINKLNKIVRGEAEKDLHETDFPSYGTGSPVQGEGLTDGLRNLRVMVEEVKWNCTSGMQPGDYFLLRSGRLYIPAGGHFCLYALSAVLPLLPAKQRSLADGDWLKEANQVICPDPAGNVILRIEAYP